VAECIELNQGYSTNIALPSKTPVERDRSFLLPFEFVGITIDPAVAQRRTEFLESELVPAPNPLVFMSDTHPELPLDVGSGRFEAWDEPRWGDCHGLTSPTDSTTGLPIPILVIDPLFRNTNTRMVDYHHLFHPKVDYLRATDADIALRRSYGQDLPRWLHEHNHGFFAGPALPESRADKFATVVLACAGVVPRQAIEFTKRGPFHRYHLTDNEYAKVVASVRHEGAQPANSARFYRNQIGMFFANYAVEQSIEHVLSNAVIDEFLNTKDEIRRKVLGNLMLREAVSMSTEPVQPLHDLAKREGLIARKPTDLRSLVADFFLRSRRTDYFEALEIKLTAA
jgi:hypothetical protein